jgi:DNA (cytosine-5)-methyltransferase 1
MRSVDSTGVRHCPICEHDQRWLRQREPPPSSSKSVPRTLRLVDLFAGCGGLSFGLIEAARRLGLRSEVALAVERDQEALDVFERNMPTLRACTTDVELLLDGSLGSALTLSERRIAREVGDVDLLVGGPPCQGNSDLNNKTRRDDPRNRLYARMARGAEVLQPICVVIENVPSVRHDRAGVVAVTREALHSSGYRCVEAILDASCAGVPQRRRRHVLAATRDSNVNLSCIEKHERRCPHVRSLGWAIRDLEVNARSNPFESASMISVENRERIAWLFDHKQYDLPNDLRPMCHRSNHSYGSMYGRLRWGKPAQTLTTGFGSMGQGRYVHPSRRRTLTPHEAARIQTFPDYFDFGAAPRTALARMIGNAVPPLLNLALGEELIAQLTDSESVQKDSAA